MLDELFKELFDANAEELIRLTLAVEGAKIVHLPMEFPVTDVKKPDKVWEVRYDDGPPQPLPTFPSENPPSEFPFFLLNIDFQAWNDRQMPLRMCDYHVRIARFARQHYKFIPRIRQAVLYVGYDDLKTPSKYRNLGLEYQFDLLNARDFSAEAFLRSDKPGVTLFAALSGYDKNDSLRHVEKVVHRLKELNLNPAQLEQYLARLLGLSRARKITMETEEIILDKTTGLPKDWILNDPLYQKCFKRGEKRGEKRAAINNARAMMAEGLSIELAMKITGLTADEILNAKI